MDSLDILNDKDGKLQSFELEKRMSKFKLFVIILSIISVGLLIGLLVVIFTNNSKITSLEDENESIKKEKETEIEKIKKEKNIEIENIRKEANETVENITKEKDKEIENITKEKNIEIENIQNEKAIIERQLNTINTNLASLDRLQKDGLYEQWHDVFGFKFENISYANENKTIPNTYKSGGRNYKEDIGNLNEGKDYEKTERNIYDLYIPKYACDNIDKKHGVILFIHGGSWISGNKEDLNFLAIRYAKMGYITATMSYTLLIDIYKEQKYNIYRILDEISACFQNIKIQLKQYGFVDDKLELAIGGYSAGGHLSLLYAYNYIKEENSDIKFIISLAGPITIKNDYFYQLKYGEEPFDKEIYEQKSEMEALVNENKLDPIFNIETYLTILNGFSGGTKTQNELNNIIVNGKIDNENEDFKFLYNFCKYSIPIDYVNAKIPLLCYYGGKDQYVGITQYSYLKDAYDKSEYPNNIYLVYNKYMDHIFMNATMDDQIMATRNFHSKLMDYANKYFS